MPIMFILRGLPGSGKSFLAYVLEGYFSRDATVISLDKFRVVEGKYVFDAEREPEVVRQYHAAVNDAVLAGDDPIVLDNTHSREWEFAKAKELAEKHGYTVFVLEVQADFWECVDRGEKPVPLGKMMDMSERWESPIKSKIELRLDFIDASNLADPTNVKT